MASRQIGGAWTGERQQRSIVASARSAGSLARQLLIALWLLSSTLLASISAWVAVTAAVQWASGSSYSDTMIRIEQAGVRFNVVVLALALALSLGIAALRPTVWRRALLVMAALPLPLLCLTSSNWQSGLVTLAVLGPCCWLGRELARVFVGERDRLDAWAIGAALGLTVLGIVGYGTGLLGLLRAAPLWSLLALLIALLWWRSWPILRTDLAACRRWLARPAHPQWWSAIVAGIGIAYLWLSLLGALAPETYSDAVRIRLPVAVEFARLGRLANEDPNLASVADAPAAGEATYALVLALGPLGTAKLLNYAVSLGCVLVAFALGRRLAGWRAGLLGAITLYTMPELFWLAQTAYLDVFVTMLALGAALIVLRRGRMDWRVALVAGICIGLAVAMKIQFGYVAIGLAVLLGVLALRRRGLSSAVGLVAVLAGSALFTAAIPLWRSYRLTGQLAGLSIATSALSRTDGESPAALGDLTDVGYGRSFGRLLRVLLDLTINSHRFEWLPTHWGPNVGVIGYLLLGCLPLILLFRPRLRVAAVALGGLVALLLWFYTAPYLRYALPIFALFCPVAAAAFVTAYRHLRLSTLRGLALACVALLLVAGVAVQLRTPNTTRAFAFGQQDTDAYLDRYQICCVGYPLLALLDTQPSVGRVLSLPDPARLHSRSELESQMTYGAASPFAAAQTESDVLAALDRGGYTHIIVNRWGWSAVWKRTLFVQEEFLRRNAALIGGGNGAYLYRILPPSERGHEQPWTTGPELLPPLVPENTATPCGWTGATGQPRCERREDEVTAVLAPTDRLVATVPVIAGRSYLLASTNESEDTGGGVTLRIEWHDGAGRPIAAAYETMPTSATEAHRFSLLAVAPANAVMADIVLLSPDGIAAIRDVSLRLTAEGVVTLSEPTDAGR